MGGDTHGDVRIANVATRDDRRSRIRGAAYIIGVSALVGIAMGVLWMWFAQRPILVVRDGSAFYQSLAQSGVGVDMTFGFLGVGCGIVVGAWAAITVKRGGFESVIAVALGGLVGSVIAWRLGQALVGGLQDDGTVVIPEVANDEVFSGPLQLAAFGTLGLWSLTATVFVTTALVGRASRAGKLARHLSEQYAPPTSESNPAG
ncbi:MAG: DUF2567 domain-containing protein [Actinobacteria bacterium]|nr:DUF2567 domain-containing protein [Actinomycetota bacterium]